MFILKKVKYHIKKESLSFLYILFLFIYHEINNNGKNVERRLKCSDLLFLEEGKSTN